jgi:hypothetical protein
MRLVLRFSMLLVIAGLAWSQAFTDAAAVVAGSSVGVGAGKTVGQGIATALDRANGTTGKAVKTDKVASADKPVLRPAPFAANSGGSGGGTVLKTGPGGVVKDHSLVPPPPVKKAAIVPPPPPLAPPVPEVLLAAPVLVLPPPPQATAEDLKTVASGTSREEVLKLGAPASRITMSDNGHLVEIFRYQTRDTTFGVVRLSDGSVSSVQVH